MDRKNTKTTILDAALSLFSIKGYEGVSVKEIAGAVGIKDSSLYKHFTSKQDIFDTLLGEMTRKFDETVALHQLPQGQIGEIAKEYGRGDLMTLKAACKTVFLFFLKDPDASRFRRMLLVEQYKNSAAAKVYRSWFADDAMRFQENLFREMMRQGFFREGPVSVVALQFYAPFFLLLSLYDTMPEKEDEAVERLMQHVEQFAWVYHAQKEGAQ